jgi:hypothetical protein
LRLNKSGKLSQKQKGVLKAMAGGMRSSWKSGVWIILFFMALGSCILVVTFMQGMDARRLQTVGPQLAVGLCLSAALVFVIVAFSIFNTYRQAAKWETAQVLYAEGVISHDSDYSSSGSFRTYYVYFGKKRFSFPDDMSRVFPEGSTFRIYYCKVGQTEIIMSFERML